MTSSDPSDLLAVAARWADPTRWPVPLRFDRAERWYARLAADDGHEVWALSWLPGQGTDLHDHGGSAGAFLVVAGALVEETVSGGRLRPHRLAAGTGRRFGSRHVHVVTNRSTRPATSIHVYGPALTTMTRYRLGKRSLEVLAVETAGAEW